VRTKYSSSFSRVSQYQAMRTPVQWGHSNTPDCEPNSSSTLPEEPGVLVVRKHHFLVRWSHWLNVPILLGLISEWRLYLLGIADLSTQARSNSILKDSDCRDSDCHNSSSRCVIDVSKLDQIFRPDCTASR